MFEKLTPRMDKVIKISQRIARDYGQDYVGTEHLLLAIMEEGTGVAVEILKDMGIDLRKMKQKIDSLIKESLEDTWVFGRLPGTPHFRNVMAGAIEEARQLGSKVICTEHMLLALAREPGSVACTALNELKVQVPTIREEIARRMQTPPSDGGLAHGQP